MGSSQWIDKITGSMVLAKLIWSLIRPVVRAIAANTRNTTVDDDLVNAVDEIFSAPMSNYEDVEPRVRRIRDAEKNEVKSTAEC